jgi:hypothetical protein
MTDQELNDLSAALAECEGFTPGEWIVRKRVDESGDYPYPEYTILAVFEWGPIGVADAYQNPLNARLIALAPRLAAAYRELREENARLLRFNDAERAISSVLDAELAKVIAENDAMREKLNALTPSLDEALNSGDGSYKP